MSISHSTVLAMIALVLASFIVSHYLGWWAPLLTIPLGFVVGITTAKWDAGQ